MRIGTREFDFTENCYLMGILNVTTDSFSDGGKFLQTDAALRHVEQMLTEGMDILDIGGESTRPGYTQISEQEEMERVLPVIEAVRTRFNVPMSLDTYKWKVAQAGIASGVHLINDIWGLRYDNGEMASLLAKSGIPCCLMHNRRHAEYANFMDDVCSDMQESLAIADSAGIRREQILVDPGIGFAKSYAQNLEMLRCLGEFRERLGLPVLLGASRKSVIGQTLDLPTEERLEGTLATTVIGVMQGAAVIRVHDVKENKRAVMMALAVRRSGDGHHQN